MCFFFLELRKEYEAIDKSKRKQKQKQRTPELLHFVSGDMVSMGRICKGITIPRELTDRTPITIQTPKTRSIYHSGWVSKMSRFRNPPFSRPLCASPLIPGQIFFSSRERNNALAAQPYYSAVLVDYHGSRRGFRGGRRRRRRRRGRCS